MYTHIDLVPDMPLIAVGVVIWVVAISVAFGFYIPVLRAAAGRAPIARRQPPAPTPELYAVESGAAADLDHAPFTAPSALSLVVPAAAPSAPAAAEPTLEPVPPPDDFSVLIVDDNAINRRVLEMILDSVGVAHVSVENGLEAVEAMEACPHQAVLMDLQMPVMDGFEATRRIRDLQARRGDVPSAIIVVSANCLDEHVAAGREAGADCHLAKPISAAALIGELAACSGAQMAA
ncbi:response regulator [Phenylobacterium sp.]|jgi:CheY-like chemotaxis protein|uniref:response regulator n=1 Tax=Phenylobacterium sp. TaxID=1871053 RepID=UPI002E3001A8|nr:response regulator [Phenylobacterium sp.]HEX3363709.1 response regulator [Phenylobacterium sp.]